MRTAVLIHGFHLDSKLTVDGRTYGWEDLVIGEPEPWFNAGRATYGVQLAYREKADVIFFSTGASEKDGLKEAEYTYREVLKVSDGIAKNLGIDRPKLHAWLEKRVRLDNESQTTAEELRRNLAWCYEQCCWRVFLVTNRFHAPRALTIACQVREELGLSHLRLYAAPPSDPSTNPVIFEPPTRPDRPSLPWNELLAGVFKLPPDRQAEAFEKIAAALKTDRA